MKEQYQWVDNFPKFFEKIYNMTSEELFDEYNRNILGTIQSGNLHEYTFEFNRIDPLSFFTRIIFQSEKLWNRMKLYNKTIEFNNAMQSGIPELRINNIEWWLEAYKENNEEKQSEIFKNLEKFAQQIYNDKIDKDLFNTICNYRSNAIVKISILLFLVKPYKYYSLDKKMQKYANFFIDKSNDDKYEEFCRLQKLLHEKYKNDKRTVYEISDDAEKYNQKEQSEHPEKFLESEEIIAIAMYLDGHKKYKRDEIRSLSFCCKYLKQRAQINRALTEKHFENNGEQYFLSEKGKTYAQNFIKKYPQFDSDNPKNDNELRVDNNGDDNKMLEIPLNLILYGPPGTGKTYKINKIIEEYIYPQIDKRDNTINKYDEILLNYSLTWIEKLLFAFKINNPRNTPLTDIDISKLPLIQRWFSISNRYKDEKSLRCSIRGEMQKNAIKSDGKYSGHENDYFEKTERGFVLITNGENICNELCEQYDINLESFNNKTQIDKKNLAKDYYTFCTFHQSYSYEEFVEGIRPVLKNGKESNENFKDMQFDFHCGIFKDMCIKAKKEPDKKFFIFIDEINRGNISKIFGELITLIEPDKRKNITEDNSIEYNTIEVTLPYTNDKFNVPNNLYIIGTMNTADKSLALLDVALRRRFEFKAMYPDYTVENLQHKDFLQKLNDEIYKEKQSADYLIGHSYFMGDEAKDLSKVMNNKVIPLLMEYFNAKQETVKEIIEPLLKKEGYCIDTENYILKVKNGKEANE